MEKSEADVEPEPSGAEDNPLIEADAGSGDNVSGTESEDEGLGVPLPVAEHYMKMASDVTSTTTLPPLDVIPEDTVWIAPEPGPEIANPESEEPDVTSPTVGPSGLDVIIEDQVWDQTSASAAGEPAAAAAAVQEEPVPNQLFSVWAEDENKQPLVSVSQYSSASDLQNLEYYNDDVGDDIESARGSVFGPKRGLGTLQNYSEPVLPKARGGSRMARLLKETLGLFKLRAQLQPSDSMSSIGSARLQPDSRRDSFGSSIQQSGLISASRRSSLSANTSITGISNRKAVRKRSGRLETSRGYGRHRFRLYSREVSSSSLQSMPPFIRPRHGSAVSLRHNDTQSQDMQADVVKNKRLPWPCRECPACCQNTLGEGMLRFEMVREGVRCRDCRICQILADGPDLHRDHDQEQEREQRHHHHGHNHDDIFSSELGALCMACRNSGFSRQSMREGRCSRMSSVNLNQDGSVASLSTNMRSQQSIASSMTSFGPICRICHFGERESTEPLFSPCRCSGTLSFVHHGCLVHWLEICIKKMRKPPVCELCHYRYSRHKIFRMKNVIWPKCSRKDKMLQITFVVALFVMFACGAITIICFSNDYRRADDTNDTPVLQTGEDLSMYELLTLVAGVLFFVAFFIAMGSQVKARVPIHRYVSHFIRKNQAWIIESYDRSKDKELQVKQRAAPAVRSVSGVVSTTIPNGAGNPGSTNLGNQSDRSDRESISRGITVQAHSPPRVPKLSITKVDDNDVIAIVA